LQLHPAETSPLDTILHREPGVENATVPRKAALQFQKSHAEISVWNRIGPRFLSFLA